MTDNTNNGVTLKPAPPEPADSDVAKPQVDRARDTENIDADPSLDQSADSTDDAAAEVTGEATADEGDDDSSDDDSGDEQAADNPKDTGGHLPRRVSFSVSARGLLYTLAIAVLVGALTTFIWLYIDARHELDAQTRKTDNNAHAEKVALDYAVNAATMNYQDLNGWKTKLVAGTSPELNDKLSKAAESMQQILLPLQWSSNARPLIAKVRSNTAGIYVVDCFVSVQTKTMQAPEPLVSTATYSLTLDSNKNWQITDVGGIGALTGQR